MKPWRRQQWCIPPKAQATFVCAMEDVLTVYTRPYDPRLPLVCMDETSTQLTKETRCPLPPGPGRPYRYDYEYERNGVANLFMFYEPLAGRRHVVVTTQRTKRDWAEQIQTLLEVQYPQATRIVLVLDNLNTHTGAALYETFAPQEARQLLERLEFHYTPKHGSWLNMAEIELSILARQCLQRRIPDQATLAREVAAWEHARNTHHTHINWRFTTENARIKLQRLYPTLAC